MKIFFLDDSTQNSPTRTGMGRLVAVGGVMVSGDRVGELERAIDDLCINEYGFPSGQEFKWSPSPNHWMHGNLVEDKRKQFFLDIIKLLEDAEVTATVVIADKNHNTATDALSNEMDVTSMCLERISSQCGTEPFEGIVIADRMGDRTVDEDKFLSGYLEKIQSESGYIRPESFALNVLSTSSHLVRMIQVADLVTGCTLSAIAGEQRYSPPILSEIKKLFCQDRDRTGGVGVKIHPDYKYRNLYHWILDDEYFVKNQIGNPLPMQGYAYFSNENEP